MISSRDQQQNLIDAMNKLNSLIMDITKDYNESDREDVLNAMKKKLKEMVRNIAMYD